MRESFICFDQVSKRYGESEQALHELSFDIGRGEMVFLTGHSGAGKSTLLKLVALIERASEGNLFINGQDVGLLTRHDIPYWRRIMGVVFQSPQLLHDRSVYHNVALPLEIAGFRPQDIPRRVRAALDKVGLLKKENILPQQLSCGEQQRVGIARAVVHKPRILLADEPTGNLDPELAQEIIHLFEQFNHAGVTLLMATHDTHLLSSLPYRKLTLREGRLI